MKKITQLKKTIKVTPELANKRRRTITSDQVYARVLSFLQKENFQYFVDEYSAPNLLIHGENLIMNLFYMFYNSHLIIMVPAFIKNVDVTRPQLIYFVTDVMREIFDVRFELNIEASSISASCHFLVEDNLPSEAQLRFLTYLVTGVVDDYYHGFMRAIYGHAGANSIEAKLDQEFGEEVDDLQMLKDNFKIN